jgi:hypothetical protein
MLRDAFLYRNRHPLLARGRTSVIQHVGDRRSIPAGVGSPRRATGTRSGGGFAVAMLFQS